MSSWQHRQQQQMQEWENFTCKQTNRVYYEGQGDDAKHDLELMTLFSCSSKIHLMVTHTIVSFIANVIGDYGNGESARTNA